MAKEIIYTSVSMRAQVEEPMCTCLEKAGDDVNCQVHGRVSKHVCPTCGSVEQDDGTIYHKVGCSI